MQRLLGLLAYYLFVLIPVGLTQAPNEPRIALIVANSNYETTGWDLANPVNDAQLIAGALRRVGFQVNTVTDASRAEMELAFKQHGDRLAKAGPNSTGFFFYAGHGVQSEGLNYLVPIDARAYSEADIWAQAPRLENLFRHLRRAGNSRNFVVLDACRNNPLLSSTRDLTSGLASMSEAAGTLIAYATAPGAVAEDGAGNSPFTKVLASLLTEPGLPVESLFRRVRTQVEADTNYRQRPWTESGLSGFADYCFAGCAKPNLLPDDEGEALAAAITADSLEAYQAFRAQFRTSRHIGFVDARIAELTPAVSTTGAAGTAARSASGSIWQYVPGQAFRDVLSGGGQGPEMVVIPPGTFRMGSPESEDGRRDDEGPQRTVRIGYQFAVGKYEVTWADWEACVADGGCSNSGPDNAGGDESWGKGSRPVINVSWDDARAYVQWLSRKTGERYRLLTEAEWEYVARANTSSAYFWGSTASSGCAFMNGADESAKGWLNHSRKVSCADGYIETAPVGSYRPNDFGLYDTIGNVSEWVKDCYDNSYSNAPSDGSALITPNCLGHINRGGSRWHGPAGLRSAARTATSLRSDFTGFRVARTL